MTKGIVVSEKTDFEIHTPYNDKRVNLIQKDHVG